MTGPPAAELVRIEDLAAESGASVRNIRAYQEKGLLPPSVRRGRTALYGAEHRYRLRLVQGLLDRGYTFATINELFVAAGHGLTLPEFLEAESPSALRRAGVPRGRSVLAHAERLAGFEMPTDLLERGEEIGLVGTPGSADFLSDSHMYELFAELIRIGVDRDGIDRIGRRIIDGQRLAAQAFDVVVEALRDQGASQQDIQVRVQGLLTRAGGAARLIFLHATTALLAERHGFDAP